MLLKYFYDKSLAHASYMVGCQKSGEALIIDPGRNIDPYLEAAKAEGLRIVAAAETHIHADFVSGSRELADQAGARLYLSDEGPAEWKYEFAHLHDSQLLKHGDIIRVGRIRLEVIHTPGHTPEHLSYLLTDEGGGANVPMGIFTGDFLFVGSIGRPDLLETAAGIQGSAVDGARRLYQSMKAFRSLPDHLQVWPAHGAGSACGKGLGAIPSSTVGYEKLFNPALQFQDEQAFVEYILAAQPETPAYFGQMKKVNKLGPELIRNLAPVKSPVPEQLPAMAAKSLVIDTCPAAEFSTRHVPQTINIPVGMLVQWAGFFVDYDKPIHLIAEATQITDVLIRLRSIGIDKVCGIFDALSVKLAGLRTESYQSEQPAQLQHNIETGTFQLIDVRSETEFQDGHIPRAEHRFLGKLLQQLTQIDSTRPVVAQCQSGGRSAIASSLLQRAGFQVVNLAGGFNAWQAAGLPVMKEAVGRSIS